MRRIKKATIKFLSLCKRGKNQLPVLYKADGTVEFQTLVKAAADFEEKGELLIVGYAPESRDTDGHIASAEVVKEMAYSHMQNGAQLDIRHDNKVISKDRAYVAESFIIQKSDERFSNFTDYSGNEVDVTGGWGAILKIQDPELRKLFKEDGWNGISLQGEALLEAETEPDHVRKALDFYQQHHNKETEMTPEQLAKAIADGNAALLEGLGKLLKPAEPPTPTKAPVEKEEDKEPVFAGNPMKKEDVQKHVNALKAYRLQKSVDWTDPKAVENYLTSLDKEEPADSDEVADLKRRLAKAEGRSDLPQGAPRGTKKTANQAFAEEYGLTKEETEGLESVDRMAKFLNGEK